MIEHFYKSVYGQFTFPDFYSWLAGEFPNGHIVEVGVNAGQSAAFLGVELLNRPVFYAVTWDHGLEAKKLGMAVLTNDGIVTPKLDLVDHFGSGTQVVRETLKPIASVIGEMRAGDSWEMAERYEDGSLDAVFIDADHAYDSVCKDIDAWHRKVKRGGVLAGHDFQPAFPGVVRAVTERFDRWEVWRGVPFQASDGTSDYYPVWSIRV